MISLGLMLSLLGCSNKVMLYPLKDTDIYDGNKAGDLCFSEFYLNEVMQIKIDKSKNPR